MAGDRAFLIAGLVRFVREAREVIGVRRIAVVGSLTTPKRDPKDADVLVTVVDDADLETLAKLGRRLKGALQTHNRGADIFLADTRGHYMGRTCSFRECHFRIRCNGTSCGPRNWVCNDFHVLRLDDKLIAEPPLVVWPTVLVNGDLPRDILDTLVPEAQRATT